MRPKHFLLAIILLAFPLIADASAETLPIPNEDTRDATLLNMGPLGFRVETKLDRQGQGVGSSGEVKHIFKNAQAEGKLKLGDILTGVDGKPFANDLGHRVAEAIDKAEGSRGKLTLNFIRDGLPLDAEFELSVIGSFRSSFPFRCKKSERVFQNACDFLAEHQHPSGRWENSGDGYVTVSAYAALALLASGDPKYDKNTRATVDAFLSISLDPKTDSLINWKYNHLAWFLAEYYLQSPDVVLKAKIKTKLTEINTALCGIQLEQTEFPYWYAHGEFKKPEPGPGDGYVYLGVQVANTLVSWSLMQECGVDVDQQRVKNTWQAVMEAGPTGEMPYAARKNQPGGDGDAFGRTGVSAVAAGFSTPDRVYQRAIAGSLERQLDTNFFNSHGTSAMGKTWGALGCFASDMKLYRGLMDHYKPSIDLMRLSDGRFVPQPAGTHTGDFDGGWTYGHVWTTACNALMFAPASRKLRIAGASYPLEKRPLKSK